MGPVAKSAEDMISIAVEGKVSETFGPTIGEWNPDASTGQRKRFNFLKDLLGLDEIPAGIQYQLLHRTASAVLEAQRFNAKHAVLLVHSFSPEKLWFDDFADFVMLFGKVPQIEKMVQAEGSRIPLLYFAWVQEDEPYLKR